VDCWCPDLRPRCLAALLAEWNGSRLNLAAIARRLGVSRPTARARVEELEREGLVRLIPFFGNGRILLYLNESSQGFWIDAIIKGMRQIGPDSRFFWWRTGRVRQIDLLAATGGRRIGFCISESGFLQNRGWWPLQIGDQSGLIHHGYFLYPGDRAFKIRQGVSGLPLGAFVSEMEDWILHRHTDRAVLEAMSRINRLSVERMRFGSRENIHGLLPAACSDEAVQRKFTLQS
jgi:hypothetical protein